MPPSGDSDRAHPDLDVAGPGEELNRYACVYVCVCTPVLLAANWLSALPPPPSRTRGEYCQHNQGRVARVPTEHEAAMWGGDRALVQEPPLGNFPVQRLCFQG